MKKILVITMSIFMAFSMTACGNKKEDAPLSNASTSSVSGNNVNGNNDSMKEEDYDMYYGKISTVVGNEIEVSIANNPYENNEENKDGNKDGNFAGEMTTSAMAVGEGEVEQGGAEERIEMEFTGETKSFTIPTGVEILQGSGQEGQISSLKKGSVIMILVNKESGVVTNVTIMG